MEIRVHPTFVELLTVWDAVFDDVKKLVTKGLSWDDIEPLAILAAAELIAPDFQETYVRLARRAYVKCVEEMT